MAVCHDVENVIHRATPSRHLLRFFAVRRPLIPFETASYNFKYKLHAEDL